MKSVKYLLDLQAAEGVTDTALGKKLGITQAAVSQYKSGKRVMDDETCLAVALALNVNPMTIIGAACMDRAEKTGQKSLWEVFMNRSTATAATIVLTAGVNFILTPQNAEASTRTGSFNAEPVTNLYYVKCRQRRHRLRQAISTMLKRMFGSTALQPATS